MTVPHAKPGIQLRAVTKRYGAKTVVDDVALTIEPGGVVALVGPNGAGKSTLLSMIGRLLDIDEGSICVDGLDVASSDPNTLARRLSILRQEQDLMVRISVRELVEFGRFPYSGGRLTDTDHAHVSRVLTSFELDDVAARRLDRLSGGQRQRAFIAMVLAQDTDYVLLDEPLNSLDLRHAGATMQLIRSMADDHGKTVIVVVHDINAAAAFADRIIAMRAARVVADGSPSDIIRPSVLRQVFDVDVPVNLVDGVPVALYFAPQRQTTLTPARDRGRG